MKITVPSFILVSVTLLSIQASSTGALLVYEGYDYALSSGNTMAGTTTNATGLTGDYGVAGGGTGSSTYLSTGLSFGGNFLAASGGAVRLSCAAGANNSSILGVALDVAGGAQSGTLWNSYLVNFEAKQTSIVATTGQGRVSDSKTAGSNNRFISFADSLSSLSPGIIYTGATPSNSLTNLNASTTYLILSSYTNVGTALSGTNSGVANLWVFDVAAYQSWLFAGGSETSLGNYALGSAMTAATTSGTFNFGTGTDFFQFAVSSSTGSTVQTVVYDELRWGNSLSDVVNVPEPSTTLIGLAGGMLLMRRRRLIGS